MMNDKKDILSISETLSMAGVNPTAQRIAVFQYVYNESDHPTPEQVKVAVDQVFPKISLATIYNTLNTLVEVGLVKTVKLPNSGKVCYDANTNKHYHFIDEKQDLLFDIDSKDINIDVDLSNEFEVQGIDIFIKGHYRG